MKWTDTPDYARETMKVIKALTGISKLVGTHVARHTFATQELTRGVSREGLAMAMGITVKQVDTYAKLTAVKLRHEYDRLK